MGLIMNTDIKKYHIIAAVFVFIILPIGLFEFGDFPRRSNLKEAISLLTILAFSLMMSQFFLAKSNYNFVKFFKFSRVLNVHKFTGYSVVGFFLIHPFLIVLPRFFEAGVSPLDAFIQILTTFESTGVILGQVSWGLMFLLGVTSLYGLLDHCKTIFAFFNTKQRSRLLPYIRPVNERLNSLALMNLSAYFCSGPCFRFQ